MSKRRWVVARLFAMLGGAGLAIGVCVPRAIAGFTNSNYSGRYECFDTSDSNFFTAVLKLNPNGSGAYLGGTLVASRSAFTAFDPAAPPEDNSCSYSLVVPSSSYSVSSNGLTTEVLTWKAVSGNDPVNCPDSPGSFVMSDEAVLSAIQPATLISSGNLLDQGLLFENPGVGRCQK